MTKLQNCVVLAKEADMAVFSNAIEKAFEEGTYYKTIKNYVVDGGLHYVSLAEGALPPQFDMRCNLLVVEDEWEWFLDITEAASQCAGIENVVIATSHEAVDYLLSFDWPAPSIITLDYKLVDVYFKDMQMDLQAIFNYTQKLYEKIKHAWPLSVVMGITGWEVDDNGNPYPESEPLVSLMRRQGDDVFNKGEHFRAFLPNILRNALSLYKHRYEKQLAQDAAERAREAVEGQEYLLNYYNPPQPEALPEGSPVDYIIGKSLPMRYLYFFMRQFAGQRIVNILGETGTGKELVARALHDMSNRAGKPFVSVDCGRFADSQLLESELFGHERGSFTGADRLKEGLFERANGGTIFLDEIGEIDERFQLKLLGVLQRREYTRVGGTRPVKVDVNVITATHRNLDDLKANGSFRTDLYYRLSTSFLKVPPLRNRRGDIALLAQHFLQQFAERAGKPLKGFSADSLTQLNNQPWEGNVRELENTIDLAVNLAPAGAHTIESSMLMLRGRQQPRIKLTTLALLTGDMGRAAEWLHAIEKGAQAAVLDGELSHEAVVKKLISPETDNPVSRPRISQVFKQYREEILTLCEYNPEEWLTARKIRGFPTR